MPKRKRSSNYLQDVSEDIAFCIAKFINKIDLINLSMISHFERYRPILSKRLIHNNPKRINPKNIKRLQIDKTLTSEEITSLLSYCSNITTLRYDNALPLPYYLNLQSLTIGKNCKNIECLLPSTLHNLWFDSAISTTMIHLESLRSLHLHVPVCIDLLPPNLTTVFMNCNKQSILTKQNQSFPQPLKKLHLYQCIDILKCLPSTLIKFGFRGKNFELFESNTFLPQSLKQLTLFHPMERNSKLNERFIFPPNLTFLEIIGIDLNESVLLPLSLQKLVLSSNYHHLKNLTALTSLTLRYSYDGMDLPLTLTYFEYKRCKPSQLSLLTNLTELNWSGWIQKDNLLFHECIPQSVRTLTLRATTKDVVDFRLPSQITNFTLSSYMYNISPNIFEQNHILTFLKLDIGDQTLKHFIFPDSLKHIVITNDFEKPLFRNMFGSNLKIITTRVKLGSDFKILCKNHISTDMVEYYLA